MCKALGLLNATKIDDGARNDPTVRLQDLEELDSMGRRVPPSLLLYDSDLHARAVGIPLELVPRFHVQRIQSDGLLHDDWGCMGVGQLHALIFHNLLHNYCGLHVFCGAGEHDSLLLLLPIDTVNLLFRIFDWISGSNFVPQQLS